MTRTGKPSADAGEKGKGKGFLVGLKHLPPDFNLYNPTHSLEFLFGDLSGAALLEQILLWFQEVELDSLSWYSHDGQSCNRNILKAPQSRDIQEGTVNRYISRIYNEGLSQVVSGLNCFLSLSSQVLILIPLFIPAPASYVSSILASFQLQLQTALESNNLKDIL